MSITNFADTYVDVADAGPTTFDIKNSLGGGMTILQDGIPLGAAISPFSQANMLGILLSTELNAPNNKIQLALEEIDNNFFKSGNVLTGLVETSYVTPTNTYITYDEGARTFKIGPVAPLTEFEVFFKGQRHVFTGVQTQTWTDTEGIWYFYYDVSGDTFTLTANQVQPSFGQYISLASGYWDATNNKLLLFHEERHGFMDKTVQYWIQENVGTSYTDGLEIGDYTLDSFSVLKFSLTGGTIFASDIRIDIADNINQNTPGVSGPSEGSQFIQPLYIGTSDFVAGIPLYYNSGGNWRKANQIKVSAVAGAWAGSVFTPTVPPAWQVNEWGNCLVLSQGVYYKALSNTANDITVDGMPAASPTIDILWPWPLADRPSVGSAFANGRSVYNSFPALTTPETTDGYHVAAWIFATPNIYEPVIAIMGQREDSTLTNAQTNNTLQSLDLTGFPYQTYKILYRLIYDSVTYSAWSLDQARLRDVQDLRSVSGWTSGDFTSHASTSHASLTDLDYLVADHTHFLGQDATWVAPAVNQIPYVYDAASADKVRTAGSDDFTWDNVNSNLFLNFSSELAGGNLLTLQTNYTLGPTYTWDYIYALADRASSLMGFHIQPTWKQNALGAGTPLENLYASGFLPPSTSLLGISASLLGDSSNSAAGSAGNTHVQAVGTYGTPGTTTERNAFVISDVYTNYLTGRGTRQEGWAHSTYHSDAVIGGTPYVADIYIDAITSNLEPLYVWGSTQAARITMDANYANVGLNMYAANGGIAEINVDTDYCSFYSTTRYGNDWILEGDTAGTNNYFWIRTSGGAADAGLNSIFYNNPAGSEGSTTFEIYDDSTSSQGYVDFYNRNTGGNFYFDFYLGSAYVQGGDPTTIPFTVAGATAQSADIQDWCLTTVGAQPALSVRNDGAFVFWDLGGPYYSAFLPGSQSGDIDYILPATLPAAGNFGFLLTDDAGNLSWDSSASYITFDQSNMLGLFLTTELDPANNNLQLALEEIDNDVYKSGNLITGLYETSNSNPTETYIAFDEGTLTFTIGPIAPKTTFEVFFKGQRKVFTGAQAATWTDTEGAWWFYYGAAGTTWTLYASQIPWTIGAGVPLATGYWDATNKKMILFTEERHHFMDKNVHMWAHHTIGTRYKTGLTLANYTLSSNGVLGFSITDGIIVDEDIEIEITNNYIPATPTATGTSNGTIFEQPLSIGATPISMIPTYYQSGASGTWRKANQVKYTSPDGAWAAGVFTPVTPPVGWSINEWANCIVKSIPVGSDPEYFKVLSNTATSVTVDITGGAPSPTSTIQIIWPWPVCDLESTGGAYTSGRAVYNLNTAGNWTTPEVGNGNFFAAWLYATDNSYEPIICIMGQRTDTTLANAQANNTIGSVLLAGLPYAEFKVIYRLLYTSSNDTSWSLDRTNLREVQDLRSVSNLPSGTYVATSHAALTNLTYALSGHIGFLGQNGTWATPVLGQIPYASNATTASKPLFSGSASLNWDATNKVHEVGELTTYYGSTNVTHLWARTTDATVTTLALETNPATYWTMVDDTSYVCTAHIVGRNEATDAEGAAYKLEFYAARGAGVATAEIQGLAKTVIYENQAAWDATATADVGNGRINLQVTGENAKNLRWSCRLEYTKVNG